MDCSKENIELDKLNPEKFVLLFLRCRLHVMPPLVKKRLASLVLFGCQWQGRGAKFEADSAHDRPLRPTARRR